MEYRGVWILAEQQRGRVQRVSYELLTRGLELAAKRGCKLSAVIFGHNINTNDLEELIERGADEVIAMEAAELEHFLIEPYAACVLKLIEQYRPEIIIAGATSTGRTLMPYVAAKAHMGLTADCTGLDIEKETNNLLQTRPAIGGNVMAVIKTPKFRPQMSTVRPHSTKPASRQQGRRGEIIRLAASKEQLSSRIARVGFTANEEKQALSEADTVVVVGRGIKKAENIPLVRELVDSLGAALGATRDVVDRGWLSYPHQVGLSGQTISPKLYIGIGVSGSIQHLAGMQTAETIVAINNDSEAPIFRVADFGIVGDLFEVVPVLTTHIRQKSEDRRQKSEPQV
jgi:electron transfer flavoprotein alpha subunit